MDHRLSSPSQVTIHSHSGAFPAGESMWVALGLRDSSSGRVLFQVVNGDADLKPFKTNNGTGQRARGKAQHPSYPVLAL